jgi:hypothetical protein
MVWIIGRTYCTGTPEDFKEVHAIQDKYSLKPLSAYGKPYSPPKGKVDPSINLKMAPREQVKHMPAATYFKTPRDADEEESAIGSRFTVDWQDGQGRNSPR